MLPIFFQNCLFQSAPQWAELRGWVRKRWTYKRSSRKIITRFCIKKLIFYYSWALKVWHLGSRSFLLSQMKQIFVSPGTSTLRVWNLYFWGLPSFYTKKVPQRLEAVKKIKWYKETSSNPDLYDISSHLISSLQVSPGAAGLMEPHYHAAALS